MLYLFMPDNSMHFVPGIVNITLPRGVAPNVGPGLAATLGKADDTEEDICFYGTVPARLADRADNLTDPSNAH